MNSEQNSNELGRGCYWQWGIASKKFWIIGEKCKKGENLRWEQKWRCYFLPKKTEMSTNFHHFEHDIEHANKCCKHVIKMAIKRPRFWWTIKTHATFFCALPAYLILFYCVPVANLSELIWLLLVIDLRSKIFTELKLTSIWWDDISGFPCINAHISSAGAVVQS